MLDELDSLDWASVSHAYGAATDVPAQIRSLQSPEKGERDAALQQLFSNIWHQGTIYSASVLALPFLIDMLEAGTVPDHEALALLVASIISGRGYCEVHYAREWINPFTRKPVSRPHDFEQRVAEERATVAQVRGIGVRAVPMLLPFLKHSDAGFRSDIASALAAYASMAEVIAPALQNAVAVESDKETKRVMESVLATLVR